MKKFKLFAKIRNSNFNQHKLFFKKNNKYFIIPEVFKKIKTNFLAYPIIIKNNSINRKKTSNIFRKNNIQTRPIFSGNILRHPGFSNLASKKNRINEFKDSDYIMKNGLLIGCHQGLSKKNLDYIHQTIQKFLNS